MEYTPKQRQGIARIFKSVKKVLSKTAGSYESRDGKPMFICIAIEFFTNAPESSKILAKDVIAGRLDGHSTVESWLAKQLDIRAIDFANQLKKDNGVRVQAYRQAWLDQLIVEFSA